MEAIGPAVAVEPDDRAADGDLGAELLRLRERASGQRLPGDAGGKAQVVLSRTRTSSPSEAPYTAAASPAGPAPTMITSCTSSVLRSPVRPMTDDRVSIDGFLRT
jgi:hypothetical protein